MYKGYSPNNLYKGFPRLNHQMDNQAYGFSGCKFWLDAAYGLNTQTNLAAVSSWTDKISGVKYEQATAGNQPRLVTADAAFNNLPVIDFYSNVRFLASVAGAPIDSKKTIVFVAQQLTTPAGTSRFTFIGDGNTSVNAGNHLIFRIASAGVIVEYFGFTSQGRQATSNTHYLEVSGTINDTNPHIFICAGAKFFLDGVELTGAYDGTLPWISFLITRISSSASDIAGTFKLAELFTLDGVLSTNDCIALSDNINAKYAIY